MDFTEVYKCTHVAPSPVEGAWMLVASEERLILRRTSTFEIVRSILVDSSSSVSNSMGIASSSGLGRGINSNTNTMTSRGSDASSLWITQIEWSSDGEYFFAACAKKGNGVIHVYSVRDEAWTARIESGVEGLANAEWAPDGRTILCFSEWGLRVTVWSLVTGNATYIQYPRYPKKGHAFRYDARYFILAERHKSRDTIGVYDATLSYRLVRHFALPTSSLASIALSPTGDNLAVWEGPLECKLYIMNLVGQQVGSFVPNPDPGVGIRCVAWHPSGTMLAVGGLDDKIYILNNLSWTPIATFELSSRIPEGVTVWREPPGWLEATHGRGFLSYTRATSPVSIPAVKHNSLGREGGGVVQLEWNRKGTLLLARSENMPNAVHLYDFSASGEEFRPRLGSVLVQTKAVTGTAWNPVRSGSLVVSCGTGAVYTWSDEWVAEGGNESEEMAECIGVPARRFTTRRVRWAAGGRGIVLEDRDTFCSAFEVLEED